MAAEILCKENTKSLKTPKTQIGFNWYTIKNQKELIFMSVPFLIYIFVFS